MPGYCHDALRAGQTSIGACGVCGTLIHEACFEELGRCAIYGCGGRGVHPAGPLQL